jgi:hypothetical protein
MGALLQVRFGARPTRVVRVIVGAPIAPRGMLRFGNGWDALVDGIVWLSQGSRSLRAAVVPVRRVVDHAPLHSSSAAARVH